MRVRWKRLAIAAPTTIGVCYFALWACAPMFAQTPPAPIAEGAAAEFGFQGGSGVWASHNQTCVSAMTNTDCTGPQLQAYYRGRVGTNWELAGVAHGGVNSIFGAGFQARYWFVDKRVRFGISPGVGWLYGSLGLPFAVQLAENTWLYTEPMVVSTPTGPVRVPIGLSQSFGQVGLGLEAGGALGQPRYFPRQNRTEQTFFGYVGARVSYSFGTPERAGTLETGR